MTASAAGGRHVLPGRLAVGEGREEARYRAPSGTWPVAQVFERVVAYCRVTSADQRAGLERQVAGANGLGLAVTTTRQARR